MPGNALSTCESPGRRHNSSWSVIAPTDGTRAANVGTGDYGTSPIFVQLSDKPLLAHTSPCIGTEMMAQWCIECLICG
jgi:hypothetical protein